MTLNPTTNPTIPTRTELAELSTGGLNTLLSNVRRGRFFWGLGTLEVEIICELKVRAANAKLEEAHV